jgi:D-3-phosphoglycerate dehydrogenase / 2-oxoglutarate reductase
MRIVATAAVPPVGREAFAALGEIEVDGAGRDLGGAEILIVRGTRLDRAAIEAASSLRVIARTGAGVDNVDVAAATRARIPIVYAPATGTRAIAEGTLALMLAAAKRLRELSEIVTSRAWESRYEVMGLDLAAACVGVIGLGAIGREVAGMCGALGMDVVAHDPAARRGPPGVELMPLDALLARVDVVTLHCALTDTTRGLVDREFVARLKPGAVFVNAARGAIVESEDVLAEALASGRLSAVALDVHPSEPPRCGHRLYRDPRVICTPHSVGLTRRWNAEVFSALATGVAAVLDGGRPPNLLNPEVLSPAR